MISMAENVTVFVEFFDMKAGDDENRTPLHDAAINGHLDTVKYLVEQGADKEARDDQNRTPLHLAADNGHLDTVKYLVEQGADKEARTDDSSRV